MADTLEVLLEQEKQLKLKIQEVRAIKKAEVVTRLKAEIEKFAITAEDLGLVEKAKRKYTKKEEGEESKSSTTVAPKYQDPSNPENKWSGRGLAPKWFKEQIDAGKTKEEMEIKN